MSKTDLGRLKSPHPMRYCPAPDFRDKCRRMVWNLVNATLYRIVPTPLFGLRRVLLRLFGARIANNARPYPGVKIWAPWNLTMENNSCLANGVRCYSVVNITIGIDSTVSQGAYLCTPSHDFRRPDFPLMAAEIVIGPGVWVATEAFIGPGVHIAARAVVGARAVVSKSVPEEMIVVGNPAKIVGRRDYGTAPYL